MVTSSIMLAWNIFPGVKFFVACNLLAILMDFETTLQAIWNILKQRNNRKYKIQDYSRQTILDWTLWMAIEHRMCMYRERLLGDIQDSKSELENTQDFSQELSLNQWNEELKGTSFPRVADEY